MSCKRTINSHLAVIEQIGYYGKTLFLTIASARISTQPHFQKPSLLLAQKRSKNSKKAVGFCFCQLQIDRSKQEI